MERVLAILLLVIVPGMATAQQLSANSIFSDYKAHRVGDIITIHIIEFSSGANEARTNTDKQSVASAKGGGSNALDFIPLFGFDANDNLQFKGEGQTTRRGALRAKMSAVIKGVDHNGNLIIEGSREVEVNNEKQMTTLSGLVRPEDITADNVVFSYNIADAKINYKGKGTLSTTSRAGIFTRILNWIF